MKKIIYNIIFTITFILTPMIFLADIIISPKLQYVLPGLSTQFKLTPTVNEYLINIFELTGPNKYTQTETILSNSYFTTNPILSEGLYTFTISTTTHVPIQTQDVTINFPASPNPAYVIPNTSATFTIHNAYKLGVKSIELIGPNNYSQTIEITASTPNPFKFTTNNIKIAGKYTFIFYTGSNSSSQSVNINFLVSPNSNYVIPNTSAKFTITNAAKSKAESFTFKYPDGTTFSDSIDSYLKSTSQTNPNLFIFTTEPISSSKLETASFTFYNSSTAQDSSTQIGSPQDVIINLYEVSPKVDIKPFIQSINCPGATLLLKAFVEGGVGPYTYIWTKPDGTTIKTNSPIFYKQNVTSADAGNYFVTVTDSTGASIISKSVSVLFN